MDTKKEKRDRGFYSRMSDEEMVDLEMSAYLDDTTKSEFMRRAIRFYCNLHKYAPEVIKEYEERMGLK